MTPIMNQYWKIKKNYMNMFLFFRMGDFYELFYDDAVKVSKLLNITLTSKGYDKEKKIPMAGVPYYSANSYISKLLKYGYNIAICDQVNNSNQQIIKKGLIHRKVTRILTPGTVVEDIFLDAKKDNVITCVLKNNDIVSIFSFNYTLGVIQYKNMNIDFNDIYNEIKIIEPSELLTDDVTNNFFSFTSYQQVCQILHRCSYYDSKIVIKNEYNCEITSCLSKINIQTLGTLLSYIKMVNKDNKYFFIYKIENINKDNILNIDIYTRNNLEVDKSYTYNGKSLLDIIDCCETFLGSRLLKRWLKYPTTDKKEISWRHDVIWGLSDICYNLCQLLRYCNDVERIALRIKIKTAMPRDLISLKNTLSVITQIKNLLLSTNNSNIVNIANQIYDFEYLYNMLNESIVDISLVNNVSNKRIIKDNYDDELDKLFMISNNTKKYLLDLESKERIKTGISSLKIKYNKLQGYFIEISKKYIHQIDKEYVLCQTLSNVNRYVNNELKDLENNIILSREKAIRKEKYIYHIILEKLQKYYFYLHKLAYVISILDVLSNFYNRQESLRLVKPTLTNDVIISLCKSRHIVIENNSKNSFIPNDVILKNDKFLEIITGPNMGGKSTYMRQVAHAVILTCIGMFVPAENAIIGNINAIYTRIGASDDISVGKSTFMVEMSETSHIMKNVNSNSLVLIDEIGRGTGTLDGISIAYATIKFFLKNKCLCMFSTHYIELISLIGSNNLIKYTYFDAKEYNNKIVFLYLAKNGFFNKSYGIQVAKLAGIPLDIIDEAKKIFHFLQKNKLK